MVGGPAWWLGGGDCGNDLAHKSSVKCREVITAHYVQKDLKRLSWAVSVCDQRLVVDLLVMGHISFSLRHHRRCKDTLRDCACVVKQEMRQDSMKSERAHEMAGIKQIVLDRIREILHEKPGITPGQLAEETGLAPNTITKYMRAIREEWQGGDDKAAHS